MKIGVCVPTLNAGPHFGRWLEAMKSALHGSRLLIIDSSSDDGTACLAQKAGAEVVSIPRDDFKHGGTRNIALHLLDDCDIIVYLTQDALPANSNAILKLAEAFQSDSVGAAYGRQLPHLDATPVAAHARYFNYPDRSHIMRLEDGKKFGVKAAFLSNSFAAYRRQALAGINGFSEDVILSEDMLAGAHLLANGWAIVYCADACVYHSHNYSLVQEFRRYFDIGVFHQREQWLRNQFGEIEGEGKRFVSSELEYLKNQAPRMIPCAILRNFGKYFGYRLGRSERRLPLCLKRWCSMHAGFWKRRS